MSQMKRKTIIFITSLIIVLFISIILIYCINKNTSNEDSSKQLNQNTSENSSISSNDVSNKNIISSSNNSQTDSEQFNFEGRESNLPNQIILTIDGKSAIIDGRRINLILSELNVDKTLLDETSYGSGAIWTTYGKTFSEIFFDEKFKSYDSNELVVSRIRLTSRVSPEKAYDISLLGISSSSTLEDALNIMGSPDYNSSTYPITDYKKGYFLSWHDVKVGDFTFDITAVFYKDTGFLYSFNLNFK